MQSTSICRHCGISFSPKPGSTGELPRPLGRGSSLHERGYTVVRITHAEYRKQSRMEEIKNLLGLNDL